MSQKSSAPAAKPLAENVVRDIRRATRKHHLAEDKVRIVLEGLRGDTSDRVREFDVAERPRHRFQVHAPILRADPGAAFSSGSRPPW